MACNNITPKETPTQEELNSLLRYEPETGKLYWRERPLQSFPSLRSCRTWNTRYADKEAFTSDNAYGYKEGRIHNALHRAHRIIWAMHFGNASNDIDHINGVRSDNRIENLRSVTRAENLRNSARRHDNSSGATGVKKRENGWRAFICKKSLGSYSTFEEALVARKAAEAKFGFHVNHGRA